MKTDEFGGQTAVVDRPANDAEMADMTGSGSIAGPKTKSRLSQVFSDTEFDEHEDYTVLNGSVETVGQTQLDSERWPVYLLSRDYPWMSADQYFGGRLADLPDMRTPLVEGAYAPATPVASPAYGDPAKAAQLVAYERWSSLVDLAGSAFLLVLLAPLFFLVAATIYVLSGRPIFFHQQRVGKDGKLFTCYKFRTMLPNAEQLKANLLEESHHSDSKTFKMRRDPRITLEGELLRKLSIDELPQLWNVLCGDMSLVGPRPALPNEVSQYNSRDLKRLEVKPGLTCIWQISGRGDVPFEQQVEMDIDYIENRSLILDLKILVMTLPAVIFCRGAY